MAKAIERNGKWVYNGMVELSPIPLSPAVTRQRRRPGQLRQTYPIALRLNQRIGAARLLEWSTDERLEHVCKFLDKPFPHANAVSGGWKERIDMCNRRRVGDDAHDITSGTFWRSRSPLLF